MRLGWQIVRASARDIIENIGVALQLSVALLLVAVFFGNHWLEQAALYQRGWFLVPSRFVSWMWVLGLLGTLIPALWIAVGWHRFIVLGERPWLIVPRLHLRQGGSYLGASLWVSLVIVGVVLGVMAIVMTMTGIALTVVGADRASIASYGSFMGRWIGLLLGTYVWLRYSPVFVAAACGQEKSLRAARHETLAGRGSLIFVTVLILGLGMLFEGIVKAMNVTGVVLGGYQIVSAWFLILLNVGIMTTIHRQFAVRKPAEFPLRLQEGGGT